MKAITKASRVNTALQVIQHMNDGMTVVSACKEVGIPRSTFYDVVKKTLRRSRNARRQCM